MNVMRINSGAVLVILREYKNKVGYVKNKAFTLYDTTADEVEIIGHTGFFGASVLGYPNSGTGGNYPV